MSDRDLPQGTADDGALSFNDGVSAIENLIDPSEMDLDEGNEGSDEAEGSDDEDDTQEEIGPDEDEQEAIDDETDNEDEEGEDGPSETYAKGKFAADDAKVTLDDGTTITVAELKRNNLFQRDYSRKTEELKAEKHQVEAEKSRVTEQDAAIEQQVQLINAYAQAFMPSPPDRSLMQTDPLGYMEAKAAYDDHVQFLGQLQHVRQQEYQKAQQIQKAEFEKKIRAEQQKVFDALPHLKDPKRWESFKSEIGDLLMNGYQFTREELNGLTDHRMMKVIHDAAAWNRLQKQKPKTAEAVQGKPKMKMVQKQRMNPQSMKTKGASDRLQALKKTGSFEAAAASLMDLDL